ncbi:MAG: hypothetical protein Q9167_001527 [Letrouitia subvulpina]
MEVVSKSPLAANIESRQQRYEARVNSTEQRKTGANRYFKPASRKFQAYLPSRAPSNNAPKASGGKRSYPSVMLPKSITQKDWLARKQQLGTPPQGLTDKAPIVQKLQTSKSRNKGAKISKTTKAQWVSLLDKKRKNICLTMYRYDGPLSSIQDFFNHPFAKGTSKPGKEEDKSAKTSKAMSGLVRTETPQQSAISNKNIGAVNPPRENTELEVADLIDTTPDVDVGREAAAEASNPAALVPPMPSHAEDLLGLDITKSEALAQPIKADAVNKRQGFSTKSGTQDEQWEMINALLQEAQKSPEMLRQMFKSLMPILQEQPTSSQTSVHSSSTATTNTTKPRAGGLSEFVGDKHQKWADNVSTAETTKSGTIFGEHISRTRFTRRNSAVSTAPLLSPGISTVAERFQKLNLNEQTSAVASQLSTENPVAPGSMSATTKITGIVSPKLQSIQPEHQLKPHIPDSLTAPTKATDHGAAARAQYGGTSTESKTMYSATVLDEPLVTASRKNDFFIQSQTPSRAGNLDSFASTSHFRPALSSRTNEEKKPIVTRADPKSSTRGLPSWLQETGAPSDPGAAARAQYGSQDVPGPIRRETPGLPVQPPSPARHTDSNSLVQMQVADIKKTIAEANPVPRSHLHNINKSGFIGRNENLKPRGGNK